MRHGLGQTVVRRTTYCVLAAEEVSEVVLVGGPKNKSTVVVVPRVGSHISQ